jgi:hypothetical protein
VKYDGGVIELRLRPTALRVAIDGVALCGVLRALRPPSATNLEAAAAARQNLEDCRHVDRTSCKLSLDIGRTHRNASSTADKAMASRPYGLKIVWIRALAPRPSRYLRKVAKVPEGPTSM